MTGNIRSYGRVLSSLAQGVPARLRSLRATLSLIPLAWIGLASLVLAVELGGERVHAALAKVGLGDQRVFVGVLAGSAALTLALRYLNELAALRALLVCKLRHAHEATPKQLGVHESSRAVRLAGVDAAPAPHVARGVESAIVGALHSEEDRLIVVIGGPFKGSSHSLGHALRHGKLGQRKLVVLLPRTGDGPDPLALLCERPLRWSLTLPRTTVHAGDLGERLRSGTLTMSGVRELLDYHPGVKLVATISIADFDALTSSRSSADDEARAILASARKINMPSRLSAGEVRRAARLYPHVPRAALPSLPAFIGVGDKLVVRFDHGEQQEPLAWAMTMAAIDWVRSGVGGPAPESFLNAACGWYLDVRRRTGTPSDLLAARRWAEEPLGAGFGLIDPVVGACAWEPARLLVQHVQEQGSEIPTEVFEAIFATVEDNAGALIALGVGALRHGRADVAIRAWERAAAVGDEGHRRVAIGHLAELQRDRRDDDGDGTVNVLLRRMHDSTLLDRIGARGPAILHSGDGARRGAFDPRPPQVTSNWFARLYRLRAPRFLVRTATLATLDLAGVIGGVLLALAGKALLRGDPFAGAFADGAALATYAVAFALPVFALVGLYAEEARRAQFTRLVLALGFLALLTSIAGALREAGLLTFSVAWASFLCAIPVCMALRHLYDRAADRVLRHFKVIKRVLLVGPRGAAIDAKQRMAASLVRPTTFVGYLSDVASDHADQRLGSTGELARVLADYGITSVVVVDARIADDAVLRMTDECQLAGAVISRVLTPAEVAIFGGTMAPGATLAVRRVSPAALTVGAQMRKRAFDVGGALLLLALSRAAAGRPGGARPDHLAGAGVGAQLPPRARRRAVYDAEAADLADRDAAVSLRPRGPGRPVGARGRRDAAGCAAAPLRPGRAAAARRTSLRGEMSLVGPRPLPMADVRRMRSWHKRRLLVAPGITGPWQLSARSGEIDLDEAARVDLGYMANWSTALDIWLLVRTVVAPCCCGRPTGRRRIRSGERRVPRRSPPRLTSARRWTSRSSSPAPPARCPPPAAACPRCCMRRGADRILFDCGEGTQRQLLRSVGLADMTDVFLTHFHADHWLGLPGMLKTFDLRDRERPLTIYGPPGMRELLDAMRPCAGGVGYEVDVVELEPGEPVERDGYEIEAIAVHHRGARSATRSSRTTAGPLRRRARRAARRPARPGLRPPAARRDRRRRRAPSR